MNPFDLIHLPKNEGGKKESDFYISFNKGTNPSGFFHQLESAPSLLRRTQLFIFKKNKQDTAMVLGINTD